MSDFVKADIDGFDEMQEELEKLAESVDEDKVLDAMQKGADELVNDVRALPKPRSKLGGGHTHMLDSVTSQRASDAIEVGWGKYYGKIVENGHLSVTGHWVSAQPHMQPTFDSNKERYYKTILDALGLEE